MGGTIAIIFFHASVDPGSAVIPVPCSMSTRRDRPKETTRRSNERVEREGRCALSPRVQDVKTKEKKG